MRIFALLFLCLFAAHASAGGNEVKLKKVVWPFDGAFGQVDKRAAQRGYQIYTEVCAACHGLKRVAYRNLATIGFSEDEIKALAAEATIVDGPNDEGEMFDRPGRPSDYFVPPYANEKAARAANNGGYPPDLSLIAKARPDGANYIYSLLTGYRDTPEGVELAEGMYYNDYFPDHQISMPPPLSEGLVSYQDGTDATLDQMARDVTIFLQWAAEPEMEQRKRMGWKVLIYLAVFTFLFYLAKVRVWRDVK